MMVLSEFPSGARERKLDREQFRRHGHNPDALHFVDPGPWAVGCPFDPQRHCHGTSPKERIVLPRSRWYTSKELDKARRKVRGAGKEVKEEGKGTTEIEKEKKIGKGGIDGEHRTERQLERNLLISKRRIMRKGN